MSCIGDYIRQWQACFQLEELPRLHAARAAQLGLAKSALFNGGGGVGKRLRALVAMMMFLFARFSGLVGGSPSPHLWLLALVGLSLFMSVFCIRVCVQSTPNVMAAPA